MLRPIVSCICLLLASGVTFADEKSKPATLTPQEIAEGWLLLFDGETTFGWKSDGDATVKDGTLVISGKKPTIATPTTQFQDCDLKMESLGQTEIHLKFKDGESSSGTTNQHHIIEMKLRAGSDGADTESHTELGPDKIVRMKIEAKTDGPAALSFKVPAGAPFIIKSLKVRPQNTKPLFNGKDLTGWKVFQGDPKRTATKFEVTKDGELSAKNGPGDLQSEQQFDDFVLQLECKTNGKALNSGVFFRCIPDQYQNGYEAQIQNAWLLDRTKPLDYGTGAIYRRVAARKVVSDDNAWFTLTIAAQGPHIATWVNGYQTVDWTDERKPSDNPRQGLRTAKGHLSIQGHDPTTDLLFRNIRIAELKKP
jgi:hypothetical protein